MSEDELEPVEADPVPAAASAEPDGESVVTTEAVALSDREGQRLVSTQTVQHDYLTLNGKVARETISVDGTVTTVMDFIYDESGRPFALKYSDDGGESFDTYYYVLNLQGDVVKLVWYIPGFEYKAVATYTYDAWGNVLTATGDMAEINPLRYRGYYYDTETGFYYLQSRYYDPVNHRFINADVYTSTDATDAIGCNMFAYCGNNPIMGFDPTGRWVQFIIAGIIDGLLSAAFVYGFGGNFSETFEAFLWGAVSGALAASCAEGTVIVAAFNAIYAYDSARDSGVDENAALCSAAIALVLSLGPIETDNQVTQELLDMAYSVIQDDFENDIVENCQEPTPAQPSNTSPVYISFSGHTHRSASSSFVLVDKWD